jgi:V-type H+-transporting ATPase subunit d
MRFPPQELLDKCNPLGMFDAIASLAVAQNMRDLYRLVLVDTPLAPYFSENLTSEDLDEMNIEVSWQWKGGGRVSGGLRSR